MNTQGKVKFITLGCRVNQYETQGMREAMAKAGVTSVLTQEKADAGRVDFVVINTCTVTEEADRDNRYWIRRARRDYPHARIVVTGCGVERNRADIETLPEVDLVLANHEKAGIADRLLHGCASPAVQEEGNSRHQYTPLSISQSEGHARAFVKIQDGCNHACSFCKVVLVRGRSRSRSLGDIVDEVIRLRDAGYREVVFAGIQLGAYGLDFENRTGLVEVIEAAAKIDGIERIRLSSIEPTDVRPKLIETLVNIPKCCPHLHIPLQSGDNEILKLMNRRYDRAFYLDLIAQLKSEWPGFMLTLDMMAGFPGEEEHHFQNTLDLLEAVNPLRSHIFSYSRREGTRAARFADISPAIIRERILRLNVQSKQLGRQVESNFTGRVMPVLVENCKQGKKAGWFQGLTENFMKVYFAGNPDWVGRIIPVELVALQEEGFLGRAKEEL